jgi:hypothetical protein
MAASALAWRMFSSYMRSHIKNGENCGNRELTGAKRSKCLFSEWELQLPTGGLHNFEEKGVSRKSAILAIVIRNFETGIPTRTFSMDGPPISLGRPSLEQPYRRIGQLGCILRRSDENRSQALSSFSLLPLTSTVAVSFNLEDDDRGRSDLGLAYDRKGERSFG